MHLGTTAGGFRINFDLVDHDGTHVTENSFGEKLLLVYFGFTNCQEVCPRNAAKISTVLDSLGSLSQDLVPLFISVDPARDTPEVLKQYLDQNFPKFTGLTGSAHDIEAAKKTFRVFSRRRSAAAEPDQYQVAHTAFTYLVNTAGQVVTHFSDSSSVEEVEKGLRAILSQDVPGSNVLSSQPARSGASEQSEQGTCHCSPSSASESAPGKG